MNGGAQVVVNKGGFLTSVARGFFGLLTATVVCGSGVAVYALHLVDRNGGRLFEGGERLLKSLPEMEKVFPPMVTEALADRRDPSYREELAVKARIAESERKGEPPVAVIEVVNRGKHAVSALALRVVLENEAGTPVQEFVTYAATPLAFGEGPMRGPIMPGDVRRIGQRLNGRVQDLKATVEVTELRIWDANRAAPATADARQPA